MLIVSLIKSSIKFLGRSFFIWSMPFTVITLNIIHNREIFGTNVLFGFIAGLVINFVWDILNRVINKKEYHRNLS